MRNSRKRRRRTLKKILESQLQLERTKRTDADKKVTLYKNMLRCYWERCQWELQQRKESMVREKALHCRVTNRKVEQIINIHEIDVDLLCNPLNDQGEEVEVYVGRGSFGVTPRGNAIVPFLSPLLAPSLWCKHLCAAIQNHHAISWIP